MSKINPLVGLIGHYDYSDEDSDEDGAPKATVSKADVNNHHTVVTQEADSSTIHPAPIPHCAWSACYDESSGFTYYWNQQTNEVTWETPPEYLLALKLAQQQMQTSGITEVSAAEWQLYQQALLEKQNAQNKVLGKNNSNNVTSSSEKKSNIPGRKPPPLHSSKKRNASDTDEEKIELITSYYNSDSESNDEADIPKKAQHRMKTKPDAPQVHSALKQPQKKQKTKSQPVEYGPVLPPDYLPTDPEPHSEQVPLKEENSKDKTDEEIKTTVTTVATEVKPSPNTIETTESEDAQDDETLFEKLKDKAKLLEKLGGELPSELKDLIKDGKESESASPDTATKVSDENSRDSKTTVDTNIDELLEEIEKKEMPKKVQSKDKSKIDIFCDDSTVDDKPKSEESSKEDQNEENGEQIKPLFPSSKNITEDIIAPKTLFPSSANIEQNGTVDNETKPDLVKNVAEEKKGPNLYIMYDNEVVSNASRKKLRISSSVLPDKKKSEVPSYTTKYSQFIEGISSVRTGLGFIENDEMEGEPTDKTVNYGKGLIFTKGETLNEEKKLVVEDKNKGLADTMDLLDLKLKYLCQQQTYPISAIQEMMVQLQTLKAAWDCQSLAAAYLTRWAESARDALDRLEATAAPPGWRCHFLRDAGQYAYTREADGYTQTMYPTAPAPGHDDMDISTTPPHSDEQDELQPPLPRSPPPPSWEDPPPPGTEPPPPPPRTPPPPPPPPFTKTILDDSQPPKEGLGDELLSFYKDIAELEKHTTEEVESCPPTPPAPTSPPPPPPPPTIDRPIKIETKPDVKQEINTKSSKKKSKVKISSSIGMKQKSVSNMVAKWQQVAEEINSD